MVEKLMSENYNQFKMTRNINVGTSNEICQTYSFSYWVGNNFHLLLPDTLMVSGGSLGGHPSTSVHCPLLST